MPQHKQERKKYQRKKYFEKSVDQCERLIHIYSDKIISYANNQFPEIVRNKYREFPFGELIEKRIAKILFHYRIYKGQFLYDDCISIGYIAYIYSVCQCVIHNHENVYGYVIRMLPIFIKCQMRLCIENSKRELLCDNTEMISKMNIR